MVLISLNGYSQTTKVLNGNKEKEFIWVDDSTGQFYYKNKLYTGDYEEYHYSGQQHKKGSFLNGKRKGVWEFYYENGQLLMKGSFINGEMNGIWEYYHENGPLYSKGSYCKYPFFQTSLKC